MDQSLILHCSVNRICRHSKKQHSLSLLSSKANVITKMELHHRSRGQKCCSKHRSAPESPAQTALCLLCSWHSSQSCSVTARGEKLALHGHHFTHTGLRVAHDLKHRYSSAATLDKQTCLVKH